MEICFLDRLQVAYDAVACFCVCYVLSKLEALGDQLEQPLILLKFVHLVGPGYTLVCKCFELCLEGVAKLLGQSMDVSIETALPK